MTCGLFEKQYLKIPEKRSLALNRRSVNMLESLKKCLMLDFYCQKYVVLMDNQCVEDLAGLLELSLLCTIEARQVKSCPQPTGANLRLLHGLCIYFKSRVERLK